MIIDVVVVNGNRPKEAIKTINALLRANDNIKVILVNNGSVGRPEITPSKRITVINLNENLGQAKAVNIGLKVAKSDYVCFMHNDIIINDKNWIEKAVNFLKENKQAGLVDVYGWNMVNGKIDSITSLRGHEWQNVSAPDKDFVEVARTDEMANIFKNDGLEADERYDRTCCGVWIDVLGRGQKLYVIKLEDAEHSKGSERHAGVDYELQVKIRRNIRVAKLKEYGITDPVCNN